jgi:tetratricopeptide (TPR) repeat protein
MLVSRCCSDVLRRCGVVAALLVPLIATPAAAQATQSPPALSGAARWADTVRVSIERASLHGGQAELVAAGALAERALSAFPNDPLLLHYRAYGLYREAQRTPEQGDAKEDMFKRAVDLLERSNAVRPMPETQALLASCLGQLAGGGAVAGMRYGPAASAAAEAAASLGPTNPRVLLLAAISAWFTPRMWGGGEDKGYALLQRAIEAFATDAPARPLPAWGRAEAYAWLGQMEKKRGAVAAARAAYQKALDLEPGYPWVMRSLLPALDQPK